MSERIVALTREQVGRLYPGERHRETVESLLSLSRWDSEDEREAGGYAIAAALDAARAEGRTAIAAKVEALATYADQTNDPVTGDQIRAIAEDES